MTQTVLGIDISKKTFNVALMLENGKTKPKVFSNDPEGFQQLLTWLNRHHLILPMPKGEGILEESKYELSRAKSKRPYRLLLGTALELPLLFAKSLKSVKESPPPLLSKTERDSFPSFRSSIKRLLSSVRHSQHIVFPNPEAWFHWWLRFSTFTARFVTETAIIGGLCVVAMSMK
ncbi:hypothetical protein [Microcoleus sp. POL10_C6]|uniref:hypothetical protein n=1 Tax=unclassified Microcoleus TaxID=2642155 RepID=UPI002FD2D6F1